MICWTLCRKIKTDSQLPLLTQTMTVTMNLQLMVMGSCRMRAALTTSEPVHRNTHERALLMGLMVAVTMLWALSQICLSPPSQQQLCRLRKGMLGGPNHSAASDRQLEKQGLAMLI